MAYRPQSNGMVEQYRATWPPQWFGSRANFGVSTVANRRVPPALSFLQKLRWAYSLFGRPAADLCPSSRVSPTGSTSMYSTLDAVCVRKNRWNETNLCASTQGTFRNTGKKHVFQPRHRRPGGGGLRRPAPASPPSVISYIGHGRPSGGPRFHRRGGSSIARLGGGGDESAISLLTNPGKVIVLVHS